MGWSRHSSLRARAWASLALVPAALLAAAAISEASPPAGRPESAAWRPPALTRRAWTSDHGLPDNWVKAIAQTRDGYLWIGTQGGLARFDGVRFVVFDQRTQPDWLSEDIGALLAARDGDLWVGTVDGGLLRMRGGAFVRVALPSARVRALHEARDGTVWVAMDRGLARLRAGAPPDVAEGFAATYVYAIHEDPDGTMWLGTSSGLHVYRGGGFQPAGQRAGLPDGVVSAVWRGADQVLWVGTDSGALYAMRESHAEAVARDDGPIWSGLIDRSGTLWVAGDHGLRALHHRQFLTAFAEDGLAGRILTLFQDREGSLWAGTRYSGIVRLTEGQVLSIGHELEFPSVLSAHEDRAGRVWFGTAGGGLGRLDGGRLTTYGAREGLMSDIVGPILEDQDGRLWFGPRTGDRLQWIENGRVSSLPLEGTAASLHQDPDGSLWVGTSGHGLYRLRKGQVTRWTTQDGLPSRAVRVIVDDGEGGLWLGTPRGLVHFRERPLVVLTTADGLVGDHVTALHRDPGGVLWVGTARGGLARLEHGRFTNYGLSQGLCDNEVLAILDDGLGNLWMSSSRGIFHVPRQQLDDVARGTRTGVSCTAFGRADGMESAQCNGGYQPSAWRARDGRLWFPTVRGLAVVDPSRRHASNAIAPPVSIEGVHADGTAVPPASAASLAAGTRRIEIEYTALSLVAPEKVRFRHRLLGFDTQWVDADTRRRTSYTNLRPGDYRFEIIASNNDGVWNEQGARWDFRMEPYFHQTAWFYAACLLLAAGGAWGLHTLRLRHLHLRNAVLEERATLSREIHDHISQLMTGIGLQLDAASKSLAAGSGAAPYLDRANRLTRQGIEETRTMLRGLRQGLRAPEAGDTALDEMLIERVAPLIEGTEVRLQARTEGHPFPLAPEARHEILHVGHEAVTNALRHGAARHVDIVVTFEARGVSLCIEDDGCGFEPAAVSRGKGSGLGLTGMADRIARLRGTFDVRRRPSGGTMVTAFIPRHARVQT